MSRERQFLLHSKDSHANAALTLDRSIPRKDERGLRQVHFARYGLHFCVTQAACVRIDRQRVAFERAGGEYVKLRERQPTTRGSSRSVRHATYDSPRCGEAAKFSACLNRAWIARIPRSCSGVHVDAVSMGAYPTTHGHLLNAVLLHACAGVWVGQEFWNPPTAT